MSKRVLIFAASCLVLASGWVFAFVFSRQTEAGNTPSPAVVNHAVDPGKPEQNQNPDAAAQTIPAATATPSAADVPAAGVSVQGQAGGIPTALPVGDGKEMVEDGKAGPEPVKELLEPVKEFITPRTNGIDPRPGDPPAEYFNMAGNRLLGDPNPQNTGGPVVSPETR